MSGLQQFELETRPDFPKLFDQANSTFRDLRRTCDSIFRELHSAGIGAHINHTRVFTLYDELFNVFSLYD